MRPADLTAAEQTHVRTAMRFLRQKCGTWVAVSKALGFGKGTASAIIAGRAVTPLVAFRVARLAKASVDDVLAGRYPDPRACPHCGHVAAEAAE